MYPRAPPSMVPPAWISSIESNKVDHVSVPTNAMVAVRWNRMRAVRRMANSSRSLTTSGHASIWMRTPLPIQRPHKTPACRLRLRDHQRHRVQREHLRYRDVTRITGDGRRCFGARALADAMGARDRGRVDFGNTYSSGSKSIAPQDLPVTPGTSCAVGRSAGAWTPSGLRPTQIRRVLG
jgi:hypothetical protein